MMTPLQKGAVIIEIIYALPTGYLVSDLADCLREAAKRIEETATDTYSDEDLSE
jgi:hypothetical protein